MDTVAAAAAEVRIEKINFEDVPFHWMEKFYRKWNTSMEFVNNDTNADLPDAHWP